MKLLKNPGFDTSPEVSKVTISTLPALNPGGTCQLWKTAVFRLFRPFPGKPGIQGALAYTSDRTVRDPGFQPGWHPGITLDPGSRGPDPGSQEPWMAWIRGPRASQEALGGPPGTLQALWAWPTLASWDLDPIQHFSRITWR